MSVSIVTFADLGKKTNLKTIGILPVIEAFRSRNELSQIICRINTGFSVAHTTGAVSMLRHYAMKIIEKITGGIYDVRAREERMLDRAAARTAFDSQIVLFHPEYIFKESVLALKQAGKRTVAIATMAHLATNAAIEREETELLGLPKNTRLVYQPLLASNPNLNAFDYVIALSDFVRDSYIQAGFPRERIYTAYSDIDRHPALVEKGEKKDDGVFRVLYVAHTNLLKGLHYLLDAWEMLRLPGAELIIVGKYKSIPSDLRRRYHRAIRKNPSIVLRENFSRSETMQQYAAASTFVFPSLTEGNPKVVLEAMAAGLPVITTTNAKSIVQDGLSGYVVPIRDATALAQKITLLYNNRDRAAAMGANGREALMAKKPFGEEVYRLCKRIEQEYEIRN